MGTHVFITFLVILLIVGLKVANRKDEISVMQLMGASMGYIAALLSGKELHMALLEPLLPGHSLSNNSLFMGFLLTLLAVSPSFHHQLFLCFKFWVELPYSV